MNRDQGQDVNPREDASPFDEEIREAKREWRRCERTVSRNYAALERSIRECAAAEFRYNMAQWSAKMQRTDLGVALVAALPLFS